MIYQKTIFEKTDLDEVSLFIFRNHENICVDTEWVYGTGDDGKTNFSKYIIPIMQDFDLIKEYYCTTLEGERVWLDMSKRKQEIPLSVDNYSFDTLIGDRNVINLELIGKYALSYLMNDEGGVEKVKEMYGVDPSDMPYHFTYQPNLTGILKPEVSGQPQGYNVGKRFNFVSDYHREKKVYSFRLNSLKEIPTYEPLYSEYKALNPGMVNPDDKNMYVEYYPTTVYPNNFPGVDNIQMTSPGKDTVIIYLPNIYTRELDSGMNESIVGNIDIFAETGKFLVFLNGVMVDYTVVDTDTPLTSSNGTKGYKRIAINGYGNILKRRYFTDTDGRKKSYRDDTIDIYFWENVKYVELKRDPVYTIFRYSLSLFRGRTELNADGSPIESPVTIDVPSIFYFSSEADNYDRPRKISTKNCIVVRNGMVLQNETDYRIRDDMLLTNAETGIQELDNRIMETYYDYDNEEDTGGVDIKYDETMYRTEIQDYVNDILSQKVLYFYDTATLLPVIIDQDDVNIKVNEPYIGEMIMKNHDPNEPMFSGRTLLPLEDVLTEPDGTASLNSESEYYGQKRTVSKLPLTDSVVDSMSEYTFNDEIVLPPPDKQPAPEPPVLPDPPPAEFDVNEFVKIQFNTLSDNELNLPVSSESDSPTLGDIINNTVIRSDINSETYRPEDFFNIPPGGASIVLIYLSDSNQSDNGWTFGSHTTYKAATDSAINISNQLKFVVKFPAEFFDTNDVSPTGTYLENPANVKSELVIGIYKDGRSAIIVRRATKNILSSGGWEVRNYSILFPKFDLVVDTDGKTLFSSYADQNHDLEIDSTTAYFTLKLWPFYSLINPRNTYDFIGSLYGSKPVTIQVPVDKTTFENFDSYESRSNILKVTQTERRNRSFTILYEVFPKDIVGPMDYARSHHVFNHGFYVMDGYHGYATADDVPFSNVVITGDSSSYADSYNHSYGSSSENLSVNPLYMSNGNLMGVVMKINEGPRHSGYFVPCLKTATSRRFARYYFDNRSSGESPYSPDLVIRNEDLDGRYDDSLVAYCMRNGGEISLTKQLSDALNYTLRKRIGEETRVTLYFDSEGYLGNNQYGRRCIEFDVVVDENGISETKFVRMFESGSSVTSTKSCNYTYTVKSMTDDSIPSIEVNRTNNGVYIFGDTKIGSLFTQGSISEYSGGEYIDSALFNNCGNSVCVLTDNKNMKLPTYTVIDCDKYNEYLEELKEYEETVERLNREYEEALAAWEEYVESVSKKPVIISTVKKDFDPFKGTTITRFRIFE